MQIKTVKTADFTMDYCRFGQGAKTLVILPGLSVLRVLTAGEAIAEAYRLLAEEFTLYLFERRNDMPPVYSVRDMARDTAAAIRALGLGPVCLFGASQGGMIAMEIALQYPELVERMILGSTSAHVSRAQFRLFEAWIQLAKAGKAEELMLAFGEALFPPAVFEAARASFLQAAKAASPEDLRRFAVCAEGLRDFDLLDQLPKITCPVLVLGSRDDRVLGGEASLEIAEQLNGRAECESFLYDAYGHGAYDVAPDYRERMLRFLASGKAE